MQLVDFPIDLVFKQGASLNVKGAGSAGRPGEDGDGPDCRFLRIGSRQGQDLNTPSGNGGVEQVPVRELAVEGYCRSLGGSLVKKHSHFAVSRLGIFVRDDQLGSGHAFAQGAHQDIREGGHRRAGRTIPQGEAEGILVISAQSRKR